MAYQYRLHLNFFRQQLKLLHPEVELPILHLLVRSAFDQQILYEGTTQRPRRYLICAEPVTVLHVEVWHIPLQHVPESIDALAALGCTYIQHQRIGNMHREEFQVFCEVA